MTRDMWVQQTFSQNVIQEDAAMKWFLMMSLVLMMGGCGTIDEINRTSAPSFNGPKVVILFAIGGGQHRKIVEVTDPSPTGGQATSDSSDNTVVFQFLDATAGRVTCQWGQSGEWAGTLEPIRRHGDRVIYLVLFDKSTEDDRATDRKAAEAFIKREKLW